MLSCARLAVLQQLEYRFNLFADVIIQPAIVSLVELTLWAAFFASAGTETLRGFGRDHYLTYAIWAAFISRISTNWMYEAAMIQEVETGTINATLVRPLSFYEYYLGQFFGYKAFTTLLSLGAPVVICLLAQLPLQISRIPLALALVFLYLLLAHTISFAIASLGFFFSRIHHLTVAKNISLWMLTGELFPLDLAPEPLRSVLIMLPFSSAVFRPVGYLTGRLDASAVAEGFASTLIGLLACGVLAAWLWAAGRRRYSGAGA